MMRQQMLLPLLLQRRRSRIIMVLLSSTMRPAAQLSTAARLPLPARTFLRLMMCHKLHRLPPFLSRMMGRRRMWVRLRPLGAMTPPVPTMPLEVTSALHQRAARRRATRLRQQAPKASRRLPSLLVRIWSAQLVHCPLDRLPSTARGSSRLK